MSNKSVEKYREVFLEESVEHLESVEQGLLALEKDPADEEMLNQVFRGIHSIKGGAGTFHFEQIAQFSHCLETLLGHMRSGSVCLTSDLTELMFRSVDCLQSLIAAAHCGAQPPEDLFAIEYELRNQVELSQKAPQPAAPAEGADEEQQAAVTVEWKIRFVPSESTFLLGLDPILILRELESLGAIDVEVDKSRLPTLADLDPNNIYLGWTCRLWTTHPRAEIEEAFLFVADGSEVVIEAINEESFAGQWHRVESSHGIDANGIDHSDTELSRQDWTSVRAPEESNTIQPAAADLDTLKQNRELIADFLTEYHEHIEVAETTLLTLEKAPEDQERLHSLYRRFHTIKGLSSFFGLNDISRLAHSAEEVLNGARDGQLIIKGRAFELTLASIDALKALIEQVPLMLDAEVAPPSNPSVHGLIVALKSVAANPNQEDASSPVPVHVHVRSSDCDPSSSSNESSDANRTPRAACEMKETVRVDRERLDKLIDMVGELVINQAAVKQDLLALTDGLDVESMLQLSRTVTDLQELGLSLRMVPIGPAFQKMNRIVRDVARKLGKQIHFESEGDDTELDKTMVDQLSDPLMHMVRNAADHGIEMPENRIALGKDPVGRITIRAFLRSGNFFIELEDDGGGLNRDAILRKAVNNGIISAEMASSMPDQDVWNLIFAPGFSTAAIVTDVSGRGVGMDVVKRNIQALNGSVVIESKQGQGSTFRIRLPLTMAIVEGLSVRLGEDAYVLPLASVIESLQLQPNQLRTVNGRGEVVQVRGEVLPLLRLHRLLNRPADHIHPREGLVVIVEHLGRHVALLVDELTDQIQAVMKSLEANYQKVDGIAGATILGNGEVAFILDIPGLMRMHFEGATAEF